MLFLLFNPTFALLLGQTYICSSWSKLSKFAFHGPLHIFSPWSILHFFSLVNPTIAPFDQCFLNLSSLANPAFALLGQSYICHSLPILRLLFLINPTLAIDGQSNIKSSWSILYLLFVIENPWSRILTSMVFQSFCWSLLNHLKTIPGSRVYSVIIEFLAPSSVR